MASHLPSDYKSQGFKSSNRRSIVNSGLPEGLMVGLWHGSASFCDTLRQIEVKSWNLPQGVGDRGITVC